MPTTPSPSSTLARIQDAVQRALQAHLATGEKNERIGRVVVAYSGGIDSTVLLHAASRVSAQIGVALHACHVHHGLSPHADEWAQHCASVCDELGISLHLAHVRIARDDPQGIECAARRSRYAVLNGLDADLILLAHHQQDQAETVLLNMLRGAGLLGLAGMPARHGRSLRPLLDISPETIHAYAHAAQLRWITDESNQDTHYRRNFIRHEILPRLSQHFPAASARIASAARHAAEALTVQQAQAHADDPGHALSDFPIALAPLRKLPLARLINLLRAKLHSLGLQSASAEQMREFCRQLQTSAPDRHPRLATRQWVLEARQRHVNLVKVAPD